MFKALAFATALLALPLASYAEAPSNGQPTELTPESVEKMVIADMKTQLTGDVLTALKAESQRNNNINPDDIMVKDDQWKAEAAKGTGPLLDNALQNPLSDKLRSIKAANVNYTQIMVTDRRLITTGLTNLDPTPNYWNDNNLNFTKIYPQAGKTLAQGIHFDEATGAIVGRINGVIDENGDALGMYSVAFSFKVSDTEPKPDTRFGR